MRIGRRVAAALAAVAASLFLSGCVVVDGHFEIDADERVSIDLLLELDQASAERQYRGEVCAIFETSWPWSTEGILQPVAREGVAGCRLTTVVDVAALAPALDSSYRTQITGLSLEHADGEYRFRWDPGYDNGEAAAATDHFRVAVTFPGDVSSYSGTATLDGTTVTWHSVADLMSDGGLSATAADQPGLSGLVRNPLSWAAALLVALTGMAAVQRMPRWRPEQPAVPVGAPARPGAQAEERVLVSAASGRVIAGPPAAGRTERLPIESWAPGPEDLRAAPAPTATPRCRPPEPTPRPDRPSPWAPPG